ncbi:MAG: hypothetical protein OK452_10040 [Thaumarchaeota archaeon]|nr:hypothetical protein [Nitrososphaerota archaeon]
MVYLVLITVIVVATGLTLFPLVRAWGPKETLYSLAASLFALLFLFGLLLFYNWAGLTPPLP